MSPLQSSGFQMRLEDGTYSVYMVKAGGMTVPADKQRAVYSNRNMSKAQTVSDALNSGLLLAVNRAVGVHRQARPVVREDK